MSMMMMMMMMVVMMMMMLMLPKSIRRALTGTKCRNCRSTRTIYESWLQEVEIPEASQDVCEL
eukprot:8847383-Karenia_brevis.AAC.1